MKKQKLFIGALSCFLFLGQVALAQGFSYSYPAKVKVKIDSPLMAQCMALATQEVTKSYSLDRSRLFEKRDADFNEFTLYLSVHADRKFDFSTGQEAPLREWVMLQNQNSIDPVLLYQKSLGLNSGNIFAAILTIHQLLRNEARFTDKRRYQYKSTLPQQQKFFDQFIDIRGDLVERGPGFYGDHKGSWYRFWGTFLYVLLWQPERLAANSPLRWNESFAGSIGTQLGYLSEAVVEIMIVTGPWDEISIAEASEL